MKSTIDTKFNKVQEEIPAKYVPALNFVQDLIKVSNKNNNLK